MPTLVRHTLRNAGALQVKTSRNWPGLHYYDTPRTVQQVQGNPQGPRVPAKRGAQLTHGQFALHDEILSHCKTDCGLGNQAHAAPGASWLLGQRIATSSKLKEAI